MATANDPSKLLLDTFVDLADTLASGYDVGEFLQLLVDRCSQLLLADTAGVLLESPRGTPALAAATSPEMLAIEEAEIGLGQGPCLEAYQTGEQVLVSDIADCRDRWPDVTPRILGIGMRSAYAFPLRLRGDRIGALNLYRSQPSAFAPHDVRLGQALADVAAVGILQERTVFQAERRSAQLQGALDSRILIEQAKGMLAERHGIEPTEAFAVLRRYARDQNAKLRDICQRVIDGDFLLWTTHASPFTDLRSGVPVSHRPRSPGVSDSPKTDGGASPPAEMDMPDGADSEEFTGDEITEVTPPKAAERDEAREAG